MNTSDICQYIAYINDNSKKYKKLIYETDEMLKELTNKIDLNNINIQDLQKNIPKFNGNFRGYYELFSIWFNSVKQLIK